ncbi:MAG: hypothetical protein ACRD1L_05150 [Terriglobales bacterium]
MPGLAELKRLPAAIRRRNRRLAWVIVVVALLSAAFAPWAVRHGWIYPEETTFAFPHWSK